MIAGMDSWGALSAIATFVAVLVALLAVAVEQRRGRKQAQADALRERATRAGSVVAWQYRERPGRVASEIFNGSGAPVFDVTTTLPGGVELGTEVVLPHSPGERLHSLDRAGQDRSIDVLSLEIAFTDAQGSRWHRPAGGALHVDGTPVDVAVDEILRVRRRRAPRQAASTS